jgi:hypothetical protein
VEGHSEPEWTISASKADDAVRATQGPGNVTSQLVGLVDKTDEWDFQPDHGIKQIVPGQFIPMTFSRPPNTEDFGPEYEDDGESVADAVARVDEIEPHDDDAHIDPSYEPETKPLVMIRRTSEDIPVYHVPRSVAAQPPIDYERIKFAVNKYGR